MKKYFLSIVALAGMLFATSCQESLVDPQVDGTTTFTVQLPDGMGTKAYGDEASTQATINRLYVEVYSKDGNTLVYEPSVITMNNATATVTLNLVSTQEYDIIFWAQNEFCTYDVTDLRSVKMNANHHNSETGAAFYAVLNDYKPVNGQQGVTLTRPFAQLNLGTTTEVSYANGTNSQVTILSSTITVERAASSFDRVIDADNGQGVNDTTFKYQYNYRIPEGTISVNGSEYQYVSMDYLAVPANQALVNVIATILVEDPNGVQSTITRRIEGVPVQLNFKTNIVGNLITSATEFKVIVEEGWEGTNDKEVEFRDVANQEELQDAINDGVDNITLTDDIELTGSLVFSAIPSQNPIARAAADIPEFVLDLNGKTISGIDKNVTGNFYLIDNRGKLTINGPGKIILKAENDRSTNSSSVVVANNPGGNLTVGKNVLIEHQGGTYMAYGIDNLTNGKGTSAITTINDATVKSTYRAVRQFLNGVEATNELYVNEGAKLEGLNKSIFFQDPSKNANTGTLNVDAGAELKGNVYLFVTEGSIEWPVEVSIAAAALKDGAQVESKNIPTGYEVVVVDGIWTVRHLEVGAIVELAGQKAVIFSVNDTVIKAVSVAELNLKGKTWQNAMTWAEGLGEGWKLASMEDLNAIYELRCELNDVLEADNAENALFWEGDVYYKLNGNAYYALYMSSTEVPVGEADANGNKYFENRVFFKIFNNLGYSDVLYSAFDCINKNAPLRDNYFARGVYIIKR